MQTPDFFKFTGGPMLLQRGASMRLPCRLIGWNKGVVVRLIFASLLEIYRIKSTICCLYV